MPPRRRRPRVIAAAVVAVALVAAAAAVFFATRSRAPARPAAPAFTLVDLDGATVSSAALRGKVVVVDFWATWCEPCRREMPRLVELQRTLGPRGLQIVGVSMDDDPAPVRRFVRELGVTYPVAMGDAAIGQRFGGVMGLPAKFLIDRQGRVASTHVGPVDLAALEAELRRLVDE